MSLDEIRVRAGREPFKTYYGAKGADMPAAHYTEDVNALLEALEAAQQAKRDAESVAEELAQRQQTFYRFMEQRQDLHYANATRYEDQNGRTAHKDRSAASEVGYLMQNFRKAVQWMEAKR